MSPFRTSVQGVSEAFRESLRGFPACKPALQTRPVGIFPDLAKTPARKILESGRPSKRGLPTRRRMLSGGPKWLIGRGSPGRGLKIAIFWVSAWSVVLRAFLEPGRNVSCEKRLRKTPFRRSLWKLRFSGFWTLWTACLPTRRRMLSDEPSCPSGLARLGKSWGQAPFLKGVPTRRRMLSGDPKWLIVRGSPGQGLEIAIFWVSAWSVVLRAFLEPGRSVSCKKNGLPPAQKGTLPEKPGARRLKKGFPTCRRMLSGGPKWLIVRGSQDEAWKSRFSVFLRVRGPCGQPASPRVVGCCQVAQRGSS